MHLPDRIVVLNDASTVRGGATYLAVCLAGALADSGLPVTFISGDAGRVDLPSGADQVALGGIRLIDGRPGVSALRGLYNLGAYRRVREWIARNDTPRTVYHLHNWSNILTPAIFDALGTVADRCVIHAHDFFLACPNGAFLDYSCSGVCQRDPLSVSCLITNCDKRSYTHKLWRSTRQRIALSRLEPLLAAATFVMIHEKMQPWLTRAIRPRHMIAIGNPVTAFGQVIPAPEKHHRLVHIGQVQRLKGVYELAEAGRRLGVQIEYFGSGESLDDLRALYPEHVYHGWQSRDEIGQQLQSARAGVVATQSPEPFCLSAYEFVATGLPLIMSDAILASEALVQSGAALPFRAGSVDSLTVTLARILKDNRLAADLGRAARSQGPSLTHSTSDWVAAHLELYSGLVQTEKVAAK